MNARTIRQLMTLFGLGLVLLLLLGQLVWWHSAWVGWVLFSLYLFFIGGWWQEILRRIFGVRQREWCTRLLSYGTLIILLSLVSAIFVAWYKLSDVSIWLSFLLSALLTYGLLVWVRRQKGWQKKSVKLPGPSSLSVFRKHWGILAAYAVIWVAAFYYLVQSRSSEVLFSPWQTIHTYYLPLFFLLTIVFGVLLFSRYGVKVLLGIVIAHTLLLHLYLPLSHTVPWGGDVWRHIGVEEQLAEGKHIYPVLVGDVVEKAEIGPLVIPKVLVTPQKYIYGQLWGITVVLSETLNVDLRSMNMWLLPLLWSVFLPILLFRLGALLFRSWRYGILFAALVNVAFPFQALGGLSLPVSLGYISFFLALTWWVQYLRTGNSMQRTITFGLGVLLLFGYPLHAALLWLTIALSYLTAVVCKDTFWARFTKSNGLRKKVLMTLLSIAALLVFPLIEIISRVSNALGSYELVSAVKQAAGQLSGWFYASAIRPHDILSGNLLFNHTPTHAFVENMFTQWRWFFIPVMILLFVGAAYGVWKSLQEKHIVLWRTFSLLLLSTFGGYVIGWFVLGGDRSFVRRMDAVIIFLLLLFFVQGMRHLRSFSGIAQRSIVAVAILAISWIATATYASGPDMRVVSQAEYDAAAYIWQEEDQRTSDYCVIADTWTLLALEAVSGRSIVGGGFPIDYQFSQPDLIRLYTETIVDPSEENLQSARSFTGAQRCWIVVPKDHVGGDVQEKISALTEADLQKVGNLYLWREAEKDEPLPDPDAEG